MCRLSSLDSNCGLAVAWVSGRTGDELILQLVFDYY